MQELIIIVEKSVKSIDEQKSKKRKFRTLDPIPSYSTMASTEA